ncbi:hypothetical protein AciM339_0536 [Aciduliprofundum sp. MAR08-339]|nr:hypothetical protein AciM339_0536 [Aciduliprofundum sp. MAR08-339]
MNEKDLEEIIEELDAMIAELEEIMGDEVLLGAQNMAMAPA